MGMGDFSLGCCNCGSTTVVHPPGPCCGPGGMPAVIQVTPGPGCGAYWESTACTYSSSGPPGDPGACFVGGGGASGGPNCAASWWSPLLGGDGLGNGHYYVLECGGSTAAFTDMFLTILNRNASVNNTMNSNIYDWNAGHGGTVACSPFLATGTLRSTPALGQNTNLNLSG